MVGRWVRRGLAALFLLVLLALAALWFGLRASLPPLDGERAVAGLQSAVTLERDARGTVSVSAANRRDAAYGIGFAHGQDRFFQMDLLRRAAAGELAALFGANALKVDRATRAHEFRARAEAAFKALSEDERRLLQTYADGVNAGLASLGARPPEYLLLRAQPAAWTAPDSLMAVYAMYLSLQADQLDLHVGRQRLAAALTPEQSRFLIAAGLPGLDAPLDGVAFSRHEAVPAPPAWWPKPASAVAAAGEPLHPGSNAWAVGGPRTGGGPGILSSDMHLKLGLPNTWYRMALHWTDAEGTKRRWVGLTLPGMPGLVVGSTGRVAWGFTNSYIRSHEVLPLQDAGPGQWQGPDGTLGAITKQRTMIEVAGAPSEMFESETSPWGAVLRIDGKPHVVRWLAHGPQAANLQLLQLEQARSADDVLALAPRMGIPTQNQVIVDIQGHLAWTLAGPIPEGAAVPVLRDPPDGRLWSANHKHLGNPDFDALGDGGYAIPSRAQRIKTDLLAIDRASEAQIAAITLDAQSAALGRWQDLLLQVLDDAALKDHPDRAEYRRLAAGPLVATPDAVAYTLVRGFRGAAMAAIAAPIEARFEGLKFAAVSPRLDEPVYRLFAQGPPAWVLPDKQGGTQDWRALRLSLIDAEIERLKTANGSLAKARWGASEQILVRHPMSAALPAFLGRLLDAPPAEMVGDTLTPRVQARSFGASERLIVAPGREEQGLFAMPGGPSGHFLSPYYLSEHADWAQGRFGPLLPGPAQHRLTLKP